MSNSGSPAGEAFQELGGSQGGPAGDGAGGNSLIDRMNNAANLLNPNNKNDPFNQERREQYLKAIEKVKEGESALAKALGKSNMKGSEMLKLQQALIDKIDLKLGGSGSNRAPGDNAGQTDSNPPARTISSLGQEEGLNGPARDLERTVLFTADGQEIPVMVDNGPAGAQTVEAAGVTEAPELTQKFQFIAGSVGGGGAGSPSASSNVQVNVKVDTTVDVNAGDQAKLTQAETAEGPDEVSIEDLLNALVGPGEELGAEEQGLTLIQNKMGEGAEEVDSGSPLTIMAGKLQRSPSGKKDKPLPVGTRTGNGARDEDDMILAAGEKFPVLKGLYAKARANDFAIHFIFWALIALIVSTMARLLISSRRERIQAASAYFTVDSQHGPYVQAEEIEVSFTEPQTTAPRPGPNAGTILIVDPELGRLQEDGEIPTGTFDIVEHTAHSLTRIKTITQEISGTLAPWTPKDQLELQPNRIYIKLDQKSGEWYLVRTDVHAQIGEVLGKIFPGTVVEGKVLGPHLTSKRYKLSHNGKWVPTKEGVQFVVSVINRRDDKTRWWA